MTLGNLLRQTRETAGLSVEELSSSTNIRQGLILEMEANNFTHCGGDIYARGHLRNIATRIGANPQELIDLYNEEHSAEQRAIHDLLVENNVAQLPKERKKISWKVPAGVSITVLVIAAVVQIITSNSTTSTPTPTKTVEAFASESASPSETVTTSASPIATVTPSASPSKTPSPTPSVSATHGPVTLVLSAARGNSYIDIIVDGKHVEKGSIFQGDTKSYKGNSVISIYLSNPAGLDVTLNGKILAPLGGENQEVRRTFR